MMLQLLTVLLTVAVQAAPKQTFFTSPLSLDQMKGKQAVVETTMGTFVMELLPEVAPNHVGHFIVKAREGAQVQDRDGISSRHQIRNHSGRRPAVEGPGEVRSVRHRRPQRAEGGVQ